MENYGSPQVGLLNLQGASVETDGFILPSAIIPGTINSLIELVLIYTY